jgi:hypothetical protein
MRLLAFYIILIASIHALNPIAARVVIRIIDGGLWGVIGFTSA